MTTKTTRSTFLRRAKRPIVAATLAACLFTVSTSALADTIDPNDQSAVAARQAAVAAQLQTVKGSVDSVSVDVANAYKELNKTETQIPVARANLENAQKDLSDAQEKDRLTGLRLGAAQTEEKSIVTAVSSSQIETTETKKVIGRIAVDAYMGQTANASLDLVFGSKSAQDYAEGTVLYNIAVQKQSAKANTLGAQTSLQQNSGARLAAVRIQITALKKAAEDNVKAMQVAKAKAEEAKTALDDLYGAQKTQTQVLEQKKVAEVSQQSALTAEQARLDAQMQVLVKKAQDAENALRASQNQAPVQYNAAGATAAVQANPTGAWGLTIPVNAPVTSEFSMGRLHPILGYVRPHLGTDLGAACGTPIKAARAGTVVFAGWYGSGGNALLVDHGTVNGVNLMTRYLHQERYAPGIQVGSQVQAGQVIGFVGDTGGSTGCHLHWEIIINGTAQNARNFVTFP